MKKSCINQNKIAAKTQKPPVMRRLKTCARECQGISCKNEKTHLILYDLTAIRTRAGTLGLLSTQSFQLLVHRDSRLLSHFSSWYSRDSRVLSHFSLWYSRDSRVLSHFGFRYPRYSLVLKSFQLWYSRYSRVLSHFSFWYSGYSRVLSHLSFWHSWDSRVLK